MSKFFGFLLLFFINCTAHAQYSENIKRDALQMLKGMTTGDYKTAAKYIIPKFVAASGGRDKLAVSMAASLAPMIQDGATFDATIGEPGKAIRTATGLYAVLPQKTTLTMQAKKVKGLEDISLLAFSSNNGESWTFIDAGRMTAAQIKQYFPDVYGKLIIKPKNEPVYTPLE